MGQKDMACGHGPILFMQVTWHGLMRPILIQRKLPYKVWKRGPNTFRFQCSTAKGTAKWMLEQPTFVLRRANWLGAYTRMA